MSRNHTTIVVERPWKKLFVERFVFFRTTNAARRFASKNPGSKIDRLRETPSDPEGAGRHRRKMLRLGRKLRRREADKNKRFARKKQRENRGRSAAFWAEQTRIAMKVRDGIREGFESLAMALAIEQTMKKWMKGLVEGRNDR